MAAITAWVLWPVSYAWIPMAGRNPAWLLMLVPVAEIGAIAFAAAAVWGGIRARRMDTTSQDAQSAISLGVLGLLLVLGGNLLAVALIR
jgi:TRAP-type C4-dicarboxylate transport system permease small subunit